MKKVTISDLYAFHFISDVRINGNGRQAVFTETVADAEKNGYNSRLWLLDIQTGHRDFLTQREGISLACWLDARTVLFAAKDGPAENGTSVYEISAEGGEARLKMRFPFKVLELMPLGPELFLVLINDETQMENDDDCFVASELPWWFNGKGFVSRRRRALMLVDLSQYHAEAAAGSGRSPVEITAPNDGAGDGAAFGMIRLTPPLMDVTSVAVSPDRKHVIFSAEAYEDMCRHDADLWLYHPGGTAPEKIYEGHGDLADLCFIDNDHLFFTRYTYEWAGRSPRFLCLDRVQGTVEQWPFYDKAIQNSVGSDAKYGGGKSVAGDGGVLYYLEANETDTFVAALDCDGKRRYVNQVPGAVTGLDAAGGCLVVTAMREQGLAEIYAVDTASGQERRLTDFNDAYFSGHKTEAPESFSYVSKNGYTMKGFVLFPADYEPGRKYPVILSMHGGPKVVYGTVFHHEMQCQAGDGYFVIYTNPRGSDGRGEAFADLTGGLGGPDFDDFMEFVDEALARYPDMDEKHIGICGGSYGGFMCNWMIGHTDRFAAAVSQRSISNYMTKLLCTDIGYYHNKLQIGVYPWEDFERLWEHSPLKKGMYAKTPTLFLQSDEDYRCYMSDALQLFGALKRNGCDTRMILFHGENHELSRSGKPHNRITRLKEMQQWFDRYLKEDGHKEAGHKEDDHKEDTHADKCFRP